MFTARLGSPIAAGGNGNYLDRAFLTRRLFCTAAMRAWAAYCRMEEQTRDTFTKEKPNWRLWSSAVMPATSSTNRPRLIQPILIKKGEVWATINVHHLIPAHSVPQLVPESTSPKNVTSKERNIPQQLKTSIRPTAQVMLPPHALFELVWCQCIQRMSCFWHAAHL